MYRPRELPPPPVLPRFPSTFASRVSASRTFSIYAILHARVHSARFRRGGDRYTHESPLCLDQFLAHHKVLQLYPCCKLKQDWSKLREPDLEADFLFEVTRRVKSSDLAQREQHGNARANSPFILFPQDNWMTLKSLFVLLDAISDRAQHPPTILSTRARALFTPRPNSFLSGARKSPTILW